ncbi:MAG: NAD(P)-binding protein [Candidatus Omnitrophota bacterium]
MKRIETDTLILGAGWSGLIAADLLSQKRAGVVMLEKEDEIGGLAKTFSLNGFKFDAGGHGLFIKRKENLSYLETITNGNELINLRRKVKVLFNNRYIDYPPNITSLFKINKKYIFSILYDLLKFKKIVKNNNFEQWVKSSYGECLYNIYFKDYSEKVWGKPCNELPANWADKRIGNDNLSKLFKDVFIKVGEQNNNSNLFTYPKQGIGFLPKLLGNKIIINGCKVYKNVLLKQFSIEDNRIVSLIFTSGGYSFEVLFKRIISSIPIVELIKLFPGGLISELHESLKAIKYRNLIIVSFIINKKLATNWHWCYFPSKEILFSRVHEPKFWSADMAPDDNKTLLCTEIFCDYEDKWWLAKDEDIFKHIENSAKFTKLLNNKDIIAGTSVKRIEYAYPLYYKGFENPLNKIKDSLKTFKNIYLIGRSGAHAYFDMEECLENVKVTIDFIFNNYDG